MFHWVLSLNSLFLWCKQMNGTYSWVFNWNLVHHPSFLSLMNFWPILKQDTCNIGVDRYTVSERRQSWLVKFFGNYVSGIPFFPFVCLPKFTLKNKKSMHDCSLNLTVFSVGLCRTWQSLCRNIYIYIYNYSICRQLEVIFVIILQAWSFNRKVIKFEKRGGGTVS